MVFSLPTILRPVHLGLLIICTATLLVGCSSNGSGITGEIQGAAGTEARLAVFGPRGFAEVDTVAVDDAGRFTIPPSALEGLALDVYRINVGTSHFFFIGDSLTRMQVSGQLPDEPGLISDLSVEGDAWTAAHRRALAWSAPRVEPVVTQLVLRSLPASEKDSSFLRNSYPKRNKF